MADQTQRLEVATVRAEVGSSILYRFSNDAVDAAVIPTESGNITNLKKVILDIQTDGAEKISFATTIYPTTAAGIAATTDGTIFLVASSDADEIYAVYSNNAGTAVDTGKRAISGAAVTAAVNTATTAAAAAQTAADTATARVAGFHSPSATDPTTRDDGTALQIGDTYFNTASQSSRIYTNTGWAAQALDAAYLSDNQGASRVGTTAGVTVEAALAAKEPAIQAGTTLQYWRGDKTFQALNKAAVGLANVDNTADINKPVSTAQQSAISASVNFTQVGTGSVTRTIQARLGDTVSVKDFGAKGDWDGSAGTDDAAAFQKAIDAVFAAGGGEVFVPSVSKAYRWGSQVYLRPGVSLVGSDTIPIPNFYVANLSDFYGGYCIAITWGSGSVGSYGTSTGCALRMSPNTRVSGLKFIHPGQVSSPLASAPVQFPPVISSFDNDGPGGVIENIYFVNAYRAIYFPGNHGELRIKTVWGQVIEKFITLGGAFNADQLNDVNASGIFYLRNNPDSGFDSSKNNGLWSWIQKNGIAFDIGYADAIRFTDCFAGNCLVGLRLGGADTAPSSAAAARLSYGSWIGGGMEGVTYPVYVEVTANPYSGGVNANGFRFVGAGIAAVALFSAVRSVCILMGQKNVNPPETATGTDSYRGKLTFTGCNFWGAVGATSTNTGSLDGVVDAAGGDIEFSACTFNLEQKFVALGNGASAPIFKFGECTFVDSPTITPDYYHFAAEAGSQARFFYDDLCEFRKALRATSASTSAYVQGATMLTYAAAGTVTIPGYGDFITLSGNVGMANLVPPRPVGSRITLMFTGAPIVYGDGNIKLLSNTQMTAGSTLDLISGGANWYRAG